MKKKWKIRKDIVLKDIIRCWTPSRMSCFYFEKYKDAWEFIHWYTAYTALEGYSTHERDMFEYYIYFLKLRAEYNEKVQANQRASTV